MSAIDTDEVIRIPASLAAPVLALVAWTSAVSPAGAQELPRLENDRTRENWEGAPARFKDIEIASGISLDFGADARWKVESVENPRYGLTAFEDDSWLMQRLLMHANLRFDDDARVFVEIGAFDTINRANKGAGDDNRIDVHQAFVDLTPSWGETKLRLRIGRQEISYGERFFDISDSANIRTRHDAVRATLTHGRWTAEAFTLNQAENDPGAFDDGDIEGQHMFGGFVERSFSSGSARAFYYDHAREAFALAGATANDRRRSVGVFLAARRGPFDAEFELVRQEGEHGAQDVEAWGAYAQIGRNFTEARWAPRIGARVTYGSGDSDPADGVIETYAPPLPRGSWFSEAGFVSHSNILEVAAIAAIRPRTDLRFDAKLAGLWRADEGDFVYASAHVALPGTRGGDSFIGLAPRLQATWNASRHVTVRGEWTMVAVSDDLDALGAEDGGYFGGSIAFRY